MGLETGVNYINDLVSTNPAGTDPKGQGDDHIRNTKRAAKQSFPGFTGAIEVTGPDSGSANAYVLTPSTALVSYVAGMSVRFMAANANTGAATLNISSLGVKALKSAAGDELLANEISTIGYVEATYDGTRFLLKGPTTEFVEQQAISAVLPGQGGNAGKYLTTDGTSASWGYAGITGYVAKTANYTVLTTDREKLIESTASTTITYALPAAATAGAQFAFYAQANAAGSVVLDPNGAELINNAATYTLRAGEGALVFSDATAWHVFPGRNTSGEDLAVFGDGADGDVTVTGSVTLTRDMYYNNLTLGSGAALVTAGYRIFVANVLDVSAAPAGAIQWNGNSGAAAVTTVVGAGAASLPNGTFAGTNTAAAAGAAASGTAGAALYSNGGKGGANGATSLRASVAVGSQTSYPVRRADVFSPLITSGSSIVAALMGGGTGSSGNGDGGGAGGGGGAANGGGVLAIFARIINRGVSSAAGAIQAKGGIGGAGGDLAAGTVTGGGGAGGGGGGWIYLVYRFLAGAAATGLIDVTGGNGGRGGNGNGGGIGGDGGSSGEGGRIQVYNLATGALVETTPAASVAGVVHSTGTGGAGGAATTSRMTL